MKLVRSKMVVLRTALSLLTIPFQDCTLSNVTRPARKTDKASSGHAEVKEARHDLAMEPNEQARGTSITPRWTNILYQRANSPTGKPVVLLVLG